MILKKFSFPILILTVVSIVLFSCSKIKEKNNTDSYVTYTTKAYTFFNNQKFDSAFHYYYKAKLACSEDEKDRIVYALYYIAEIETKTCDFSEIGRASCRERV